jgi:hypothetical protein
MDLHLYDIKHHNTTHHDNLQVLIYSNVIHIYMCFPFFVCAMVIDVGDPMEKMLFCIFLIPVFLLEFNILE